MSVSRRPAPPRCPACSDPDPAWEIASPVMAEDRVRFDSTGLAELGLFPPDGGLVPHGRPAISCVICGTPADDMLAEAVLNAVVTAGKPHRTPGDA